MGSVTLHYGPGAHRQAQIEALEWGPYMDGPFGLEGLRKDDARQVAKLCRLVAPGDDARRSIVVGPMDAIRAGSSDALLKSIEEYEAPRVRPFLWAWDLGEVSPTILSRVMPIWVPGPKGAQPETELTDSGAKVIQACLSGSLASVIKIVEEAKGKERELLVEASRALSEVLIQDPEKGLDVWDSIREALSISTVSRAQCVLALWPVDLRSSSSLELRTS